MNAINGSLNRTFMELKQKEVSVGIGKATSV